MSVTLADFFAQMKPFLMGTQDLETTRQTLGLSRCVIRLITPPFPAASRPSNRTTIFSPVFWTQS